MPNTQYPTKIVKYRQYKLKLEGKNLPQEAF